MAGASKQPTAKVTLYDTELDEKGSISSDGTGPVDAAYKAIDSLVAAKGTKLLEYSVARCVVARALGGAFGQVVMY